LSRALLERTASQVLALGFFAGLSIAATGVVLGLSSATVERCWRVSRAWLRVSLPDLRLVEAGGFQLTRQAERQCGAPLERGLDKQLAAEPLGGPARQRQAQSQAIRSALL